MKGNYVLVSEDLARIERIARRLVVRTTAHFQPGIEIAGVKNSFGGATPVDAYDYRCTILVKSVSGNTLRSEARDCDEMVAVYKALGDIVDQHTAGQTVPAFLLTESALGDTGPQ